MLPDSVSVIKHSATIHMANTLTVTERKIYNALLYHARPSMNRGIDHVVDTDVLEEASGFTRNNRHYLVETAESLREKTVRYNIFGKDRSNGEIWRMNSGLLSEIGFTANNSRCRYSFPNTLIDLLKNPSLYARINLSIQSRIRGHHTLPLYEFYLDMLGGRRGETEFDFPIDDLKELLDLGDSYQEFKVLNRDIVQKAHSEINAKTDIRVDVVASIRTGRRVTALSLRIVRTSSSHDISDLVLDEQGRVADHLGHRDESLEKDLFDVFGNDFTVKNILRDYPDPQYVHANLLYARQMHARGKVKNLAAYLVKALKEDYRPKAAKSVSAMSSVPPFSSTKAKTANNGEVLSARVKQGRALFAAMSPAEQHEMKQKFEQTQVYLSLKKLMGSKISEDSRLYLGSFFEFVTDSTGCSTSPSFQPA